MGSISLDTQAITDKVFSWGGPVSQGGRRERGIWLVGDGGTWGGGGGGLVMEGGSLV